MFNKLNLKPTYSTYENDIGYEFYTPTLSVSKTYDRATAYFSAKALANYAKGLEVFAKKGNKYRLLISSEISETDFDKIKKGYTLRKSILENLLDSLDESLSVQEECNLSNLAYLIAIEVIDIKFGFTKQGIFHDKFGILKDYEGNIICFRGSNNETDAAFQANYESFDITCSWQSSKFDYDKITKSIDTFERLWNNEIERIYVCDVVDVILNKILSYNKGNLIVEHVLVESECVVLDYIKGYLELNIKIDASIIWNSSLYKMKLRRFVEKHLSVENKVVFKQDLKYPDFKKIIKILENDSQNRKYRFFVTNRLRRYISERELYIHERSKFGLAIKNRDFESATTLNDKYSEYSEIVNESMIRNLREKQMWDSFFMCCMKKSSNFSVPGSGKTSSALGVFAYLSHRSLIDKMVVIGPLNTFQSWIDEFKMCFGNKKNLEVFNIKDYKGIKEKSYALKFDSYDKNLMLFNYEGLNSILSEVCGIIDDKTLLIFDEVHKIKALEGQRASCALEISKKSNYTIIMTGTPIPNTYADIKNMLEILYHDEYTEFFNFSAQTLKNPSPTDVLEINKKLQPFFCRTTKKELNVPSANDDILVSVNSSSAENEIFKILTLKYAKNKLLLIIRILQLESNPKMLLNAINYGGEDFTDILDTSGSIEDIDYKDFSSDIIKLINSIDKTSKFNKCILLTEKLIQDKKTVIIWCIFVDSIKRISNELESKGIVVGTIFGDVDVVKREEILQKFKNGEIDVLITNPHTLAESVSLHKVCHDAIYFEYSYNLVHLLQSKDRIHRLGLENDAYTQYYYLQNNFLTNDNVEFSLDNQIYTRLNEKEEIMLQAIENDILETVTASEEELELIFIDLKL